MAHFELNTAKTVLLIIDMQNDWLRSGAPMYMAQARTIIPKMKMLIRACREAAIRVIYIINSFRADGSDVGLMGEFSEPVRKGLVAVEGSTGMEVYSAIKPSSGDIFVRKHTYSSFQGTDLEGILRNLKIDTLIVCGIATNVCVETSVRDGFCRGFRSIVISDCVVTRRKIAQTESLRTMNSYFAEVINLAELKQRLSSSRLNFHKARRGP